MSGASRVRRSPNESGTAGMGAEGSIRDTVIRSPACTRKPGSSGRRSRLAAPVVALGAREATYNWAHSSSSVPEANSPGLPRLPEGSERRMSPCELRRTSANPGWLAKPFSRRTPPTSMRLALTVSALPGDTDVVTSPVDCGV